MYNRPDFAARTGATDFRRELMGDGIRESGVTDSTAAAGVAKRSFVRRPDRAGVVAGAAILAACTGLVLYGVLTPEPGKPKPAVATAPVTYEVTGTGTADITYKGRSGSAKATVVKSAALPWRKTVDVPLGQDPIVSIVLGERGGQARCTLAVRGRHAQSATTSGGFGRATCAGSLPAPGATGGQATAADRSAG
ncbi:hypothetical protein TNCT1_68620 [Streptomyces sp. 1-11]|nr:hypothetical protein TNCT1_68620 [Streptomyces sp. 1-11]